MMRAKHQQPEELTKELRSNQPLDGMTAEMEVIQAVLARCLEVHVARSGAIFMQGFLLLGGVHPHMVITSGPEAYCTFHPRFRGVIASGRADFQSAASKTPPHEEF